MSRFTDPAKAGELICGSAWPGPAREDLDLLPEPDTDHWWPQPDATPEAEAQAEAEAGG